MTELQKDNSLDFVDNIEINYKDKDAHFAKIIGCIEDTIMNEEFIKLHNKFMEEHWHLFDDQEENKLEYTDIFKKYNEVIEKFIEKQLIAKFSEFNMIDFEQELSERKNELDGEIFEILATFSDFVSFKNKFLDYKAVKEGKIDDFSVYLSVSQYKMCENY